MTDRYTIWPLDCRIAMSIMAPDSLDAAVTDPPYELGFMGKGWDNAGVAFDPETWRAVYRVLKPGAHLLAFSGSRTYHRMVCAIEDAGFEIRDQIMWIYGSGFPKSLDVSKQPGCAEWQGWGTALKPAHEPIVVARKPLIGTVAQNVLTHGTGALNIDGCRVPGEGNKTFNRGAGDRDREQYRTGTTLGAAIATDLGRFPANLIHDGSDEVLALFPQTTSVGHTPSARGKGGVSTSGHAGQSDIAERHHDTGSAARFFYCAKASKADRNSGGLPSSHPTVKPTDLMRYLTRLVTPPSGTVLDPFAGSGSTGKAAILEGFHPVLCEMTDEYLPILQARIDHAVSVRYGSGS